MMQNLSIQSKGLQKSYKMLHVLNGVDFEVEKSSIFALLSSNGFWQDSHWREADCPKKGKYPGGCPSRSVDGSMG
jgi:hypothetical protein